MFQFVDLLCGLTQWNEFHHTVKIGLKYFMVGVKEVMQKTML